MCPDPHVPLWKHSFIAISEAVNEQDGQNSHSSRDAVCSLRRWSATFDLIMLFHVVLFIVLMMSLLVSSIHSGFMSNMNLGPGLLLWFFYYVLE